MELDPDDDQTTTVCCMCGDVGFPEKLFYCTRCRWRSQHSYCSNYYHGGGESSPDHRSTEKLCDWCQQMSEKASRRTSTSSFKRGGSSCSSKKSSAMAAAEAAPPMISPNDNKGKNSGGGGASAGFPSPRTATRRYKLLKDVMC